MGEDLERFVVIVDVIMLLGVAAFQGMLAIGMPLGAAAWGGKYPGVLPSKMRAASTVSLFIQLVFAAYVLARGELMFAESLGGSVRPALWAMTVFLAVGTLANAASRSRNERLIWTPYAGVLFILTGSLAWSA